MTSASAVGERADVDLSGAAARVRPRLAFLGVGWIGRHRMEAITATRLSEIVGIADPSSEMRASAAELAPAAELVTSLDELLELQPDGIVIATPSALHAEQAVAALRGGAAVFCQKPLGRTAQEVEMVVRAARDADRLLAVDLSYRFTQGVRAIRELAEGRELGEIFAVDLVFHNAYGPDKPWFYDPALSGGGCVMDLGTHLVDLALWMLDFPEVEAVDSQLLSGGRPLGSGEGLVEDFGTAQLRLADGRVVRLACSWRLPAGRDAVIEAAFYGTAGGAAFRNVDGSFYDFVAERYDGTARTPLASPPDDWGGRAIVHWADRLARGDRFDPAADHLVQVAGVLDRIYGR